MRGARVREPIAIVFAIVIAIVMAAAASAAFGACSRETGEQPSAIGPANDDLVDAGDAALSKPLPEPPTAAPTSATDPAAAEASFQQAKKLMSEGKYAEACPRLEESDRLDPADGTKLNLAVCYEQIGDTSKACETLAAALKSLRAKSPTNAAREQFVLERMAKLKCPT